MKLIIDIPDDDFNFIKTVEFVMGARGSCKSIQNDVINAIKNGTPYNPSGDLISREALKKSLNFVYDCDYIGSKSKEGIVSDIIDEIDNAPTVVNEYTKGFTDGERSGRHLPLTDEEKAVLIRQWRPHGEWIIDGHHYKCSRCGKTLAIMFSETDDDLIGCPFCLADMRGGRE